MKVLNHDQHRRDADTLMQNELIRAAKRQTRNAVEWNRRAFAALVAGNAAQAERLFQQAMYEIQTIR